jgi:hypothetical protein
MKFIILLLFPFFSYSQVWIFQLHGNRCTVTQNCTNTTNLYNFSFSGFPPNDFGGQQMQVQMVYYSQNGGNQGSNGTPVSINPNGTASFQFSLSGTVNMYLYDEENCCGPERNANFDFGQITYQPCVLPIILEYIKISNGNLVFKTDMESNVRGYEIEGAIEGGKFDSLGWINAKGAGEYSWRLPVEEKTADMGAGKGWMLLALVLFLVVSLPFRKQAVVSLWFSLAVLGGCTKTSIQSVAPKEYKYFRIGEVDGGSSKVVWYSEVVACTH